jgi:hypothetical protein
LWPITRAPGLTRNLAETSGSPAGTLSAEGVLIEDSGSQTQQNDVLGEGAAITIGPLGIRIFGSGSGSHDNEIATNINNSPITVNGSVTVIDSGSGHSAFAITAGADNSFVTVGGNVNYDDSANTTGRSAVDIHGNVSLTNSTVTIDGSLSLNLAKTSGTAADNAGFDHNQVHLGSATSGAGYGLSVDGVVLVAGGNGQDRVLIQEAQLKLGGWINLMGNPSPGSTWRDLLEIDGSAIGGPLTVAMSGPNAQINLNNGQGFQPDVFSGAFVALMSGANPVIYVADGTGSGYSHVTFAAGATVVGTAGGGGIVTYHVANVTGTITPVNFTKVAV